jgi:hypothetical protein
MVGYFLNQGSVLAVSTVRLAMFPTTMVNSDFTWVSPQGYVWWYALRTPSPSLTLLTSLKYNRDEHWYHLRLLAILKNNSKTPLPGALQQQSNFLN